jgi:hypothetical protein
MSEKTQVQLYFGEKSRVGWLHTGTSWLGGGIKTHSAGDIKGSLPSVIEYLEDAQNTVQHEYDNYDTWKSWAMSFWGVKKTKLELETFIKDITEVLTYLKEKQTKHKP